MSTLIKLSARHDTLNKTKVDVLAYLVFENRDIFTGQLAILKKHLGNSAAPITIHKFSGKPLETLVLHPERLGSKALLLIGAGKLDAFTFERLRRLSATVAKSARSLKAKSVALLTPPGDVIARTAAANGGTGIDTLWMSIGTALAEGAALALYKFDKYQTSSDAGTSQLKELILIGETKRQTEQLKEGIALARVVCEATFLARDLENAPGSEIFPETLAARAQRSGRARGYKVSVWNEKRIRQAGMGGLLGVSQGSEKPPRFIVMEYHNGRKNAPRVVLVGKGVTFDSGGISIKPSAGMAEMKMDMSGAAAVIGTMDAVARLKLPVRLTGLIPATENLLGGGALKPGDIIRHHNGKTSEVDNTDAEGRLILADALSYASRFNPDVVIDLATLTGACVVALGHYATGMMGNDQRTMEQLKASGERTFERVWQLPMFEEYERLVKSDIADVKNVGGRWGGAITAAMFLKKFIGDYNWVHLDIAGTAIMEESLDYVPKGGSGVGVRLLVDYLRHLS